MPVISAGLLLYRFRPALELLLVHPGGPFWARKDADAWSIPKGVAEPGEDLESAARREFFEETGYAPEGVAMPLGEFRQSGGKTVAAFAMEGDFDPAALVSNVIMLEWPPRSGRTIEVPEVDRAAWMSRGEAQVRLHKGQKPIVGVLSALLKV
jgi:predicted NUDIX family NTP pyrophosphohydrolase